VWGALGQWAGALGTVLAVTVALRISQREADTEAERRRAEQTEQELEQARLVVAAIEYPSISATYFAEQNGREAVDVVRITNFSARQVFYPRVEGFVHQNGGTMTWDIAGDADDYESAPTVLGPGQPDVIPVSLRYDPPVAEDMYPVRTKVIIGYTDADGRRWRRIDLATPSRVESGNSFPIGGPDWYRADL
jgi:hypothetical protein